MTAVLALRHVASLVHAEGVIRFVLNVLWLIFGGGLILAASYGIAALICFLLVVTTPFGVASLRLAIYDRSP